MRILAAATFGLRRVLDLLLVVLIVIVLLGVLLGKLVPLTGRQTIIVGGSSMEPNIGLGAAVIIRPVGPEELAVGDVVTLRAGEKHSMFTHRIIEVADRPDGRWIRTKGDANRAADPTLVHASAVIGRVDLAIPLAGYLIALLSVPTGVLFLLGLAATLLAAAWLLESLELDRAGKVHVSFVPAGDRGGGEPIALRAAPARSLAADASFGGGVRLNVADQLATVRAARQRRTTASAPIRRPQRTPR